MASSLRLPATAHGRRSGNEDSSGANTAERAPQGLPLETLEPCEAEVSCTVPRVERSREAANLSDQRNVGTEVTYG